MNHYEFDPEPSDLKFLWRAMMLVIGLIIGSIIGIVVARGADVVWPARPRDTCDRRAYLGYFETPPDPPMPTVSLLPPWRLKFIGPMPTPESPPPLPTPHNARAAIIKEWTREPMRRRNQ